MNPTEPPTQGSGSRGHGAASDLSAFPYLVQIDSRCDASGRWHRHVECPDQPALFGTGESLTEAFAEMERRYLDQAGDEDTTYRVAHSSGSTSSET